VSLRYLSRTDKPHSQLKASRLSCIAIMFCKGREVRSDWRWIDCRIPRSALSFLSSDSSTLLSSRSGPTPFQQEMLMSPFARTRNIFLIVLAVVAAFVSSRPLLAQSGPPATERQDLTETFFGTRVTDPYRWLENWKDGKGAEWLKAQDTF